MSKITDATEALRWVVSDECEADDTITILATEVSALRARLADAEAEAERANKLVNSVKHSASVLVSFTREGGEVESGLCAILSDIEAYISSRPEGEVRDGR